MKAQSLGGTAAAAAASRRTTAVYTRPHARKCIHFRSHCSPRLSDRRGQCASGEAGDGGDGGHDGARIVRPSG